MSFFPDGFDPRAQVTGMLELVEIDAPSGVVRFLVGQQGRFTDVSGNVWWGSQLVSVGKTTWTRDGTAPSGEVTFSYFQDPSAPSLIDDLKESGDNVLNGREMRIYAQPINSYSELYAPVFAPVLLSTLTCGSLGFEAEGDVTRKLILRVEGAFQNRLAQRGYYYTTTDHSALVGSANPSLSLMPSTGNQEEKLYG